MSATIADLKNFIIRLYLVSPLLEARAVHGATVIAEALKPQKVR
jgi:hypothetical protein